MTVNPDSMGILTGEWRLSHGGVSLRCATDPGDLQRISYLRDQSFGAAPSGKAALDPFDDQSQHLFVESLHDKRILAACRVRFHADVASACQGYTGQFYDLADLGRIGFPLLELGRLCTLRPAGGQSEGQAAALRLIWAGLADLVRLWGAKAIFGCASFPAADRLFHLAALGQLAAVNRDALGDRLCARVDPALRVALDVADPKSATVTLPPLLRSYLSLGAWVGPDAVLDHELDTLHVLTVLQIDRVPPARRAAMAAFVASIGGQPVDGPLQSA